MPAEGKSALQCPQVAFYPHIWKVKQKLIFSSFKCNFQFEGTALKFQRHCLLVWKMQSHIKGKLSVLVFNSIFALLIWGQMPSKGKIANTMPTGCPQITTV